MVVGGALARVKTIRALERGLDVIWQLDHEQGTSLQDLHQRSGIAKATLLRILATLEQRGVVWRALGDGLYRRTGRLVRSYRNEEDFNLVNRAKPLLMQLQRKVLWPSDLMVFRDFQMEMIDTTRRVSRLALNYYPVGCRVDLFLSAPGRAFLAFCSTQMLEAVLRHYQEQPPTLARSVKVLADELPKIITQTRMQGYACRDDLFGGSYSDMSEFDDELDAIAVPVLQQSEVVACINIVWRRKYRLRAKMIREHLGELRDTAAAIADTLNA